MYEYAIGLEKCIFSMIFEGKALLTNLCQKLPIFFRKGISKISVSRYIGALVQGYVLKNLI